MSPAPPPTAAAARAAGPAADVAGLAAPVRVVRDTWGVPHIYAANQDDLFFAQGFVQAQDRLFQMDLWRRSAQGRLSEVLGPNFIERDAMTRRIQYRGDRGRGVGELRAGRERRSPTAFVRGVNAWVALARERPPEEFVLAGWMPEPWAADDLLNRTEAFTASGDALDEVFRARLTAAVGLARARLLLPDDARDRDRQPASTWPRCRPWWPRRFAASARRRSFWASPRRSSTARSGCQPRRSARRPAGGRTRIPRARSIIRRSATSSISTRRAGT